MFSPRDAPSKSSPGNGRSFVDFGSLTFMVELKFIFNRPPGALLESPFVQSSPQVAPGEILMPYPSDVVTFIEVPRRCSSEVSVFTLTSPFSRLSSLLYLVLSICHLVFLFRRVFISLLFCLSLPSLSVSHCLASSVSFRPFSPVISPPCLSSSSP